ncbi:hypothetical protein Cenrod_1975 [Candidatus Symbiobacter mobilis CR]|uniref:Toprim domain-containing protein n=2 Tax=Candidatus Symbiobacter TaxID=1436289 RepID=U5ND04_9BURK|nr:hypothetical protein Cenrod_1975 [Candidatus Symbiobacter mobilis CR]
MSALWATHSPSEIERARSALHTIPPDGIEYPEWVRVIGSAAANGLTLDDVQEWDAQSARHDHRAVRDTFKSMRRTGRATLFWFARQHGFADDCPLTADDLTALRADQEARIAQERADQERRTTGERWTAHRHAKALWSRAQQAIDDHPYLVRKRLPGTEARELPAVEIHNALGYRPAGAEGEIQGRCLVLAIAGALPDGSSGLTNVELIDEGGQKVFLRGAGTLHGSYILCKAHPLPDNDGAGATILVAEGWATALAASLATGHPALAALSCTNLRAVVDRARGRWPRAGFVILADLDKTGTRPHQSAVDAAHATGARLAVPSFGDGESHPHGDFADLWALGAVEAIRRAIAGHEGRAAA